MKRIAIVNRGEAGLRGVRGIADWRARFANTAVSIALYSEVDRHSLYVLEADERHPITSYLDYAALENALRECRADAAWVGWGFVAEHAAFAELCARLGIVFIGPGAEAMRQLGDKITSKLLAERAGVPVAAWSGGAVASAEDATRWVEKLGVPVMIKASAGGGGRGIRRVTAAKDAATAFTAASSEAERAFGRGDVYVEKMVSAARHVEVQIVADHHGTIWAAGLRDCTVQRKHQKVVEEAPPTAVPAKVQEQMREAAVRLAREAAYSNVGTVEFLVSGEAFWFMEMNTRLQVEHPVTELTSGIDLVEWQLRIAAGEHLPKTPPVPRGHAIEVRLNAEDPERDFAPAPGVLATFRLPAGPGVRVDTGYVEGDEVPAAFDSMLAKIIVYGADREAALVRLRRALKECKVAVKNGASNRSLLSVIAAHPDFSRNSIDLHWLDGLSLPEKKHRALGIAVAAVAAFGRVRKRRIEDFVRSARRGRLQASDAAETAVALICDGRAYELSVAALSDDTYRVTHGQSLVLTLEAQNAVEHRLRVGGEEWPVLLIDDGATLFVEVAGEPHFCRVPSGSGVVAPAPALVSSVSVSVGERISAGQVVAVLEAMKTEMPIRATTGGVVKAVRATAGQQVTAGAVLVDIDAESGAPAEAAPPLFSIASEKPQATTLLRRMLGGGDLAAEEIPLALKSAASADFAERLQILRRMAEALAIGWLEPDALMHALAGRASSARFAERLKRAGSNANAPGFARAAFYLHRAFVRCEKHLSGLAELLRAPRPAIADMPAQLAAEWLSLLEDLVEISSGGAVELHEFARQVRFTDFEQPRLDALKESAWRKTETALTLMAQTKVDHAALATIAGSPLPLLARALAWGRGDAARVRVLLEAFLVRFYGQVRALSAIAFDGSVATTRFVFREQQTEVFAAMCTSTDLAPTLAMLNQRIDGDAVIDLLLSDEMPKNIAPALDTLSAKISRVCVSGLSNDAATHATFARDGAHFVALDQYRDVHPMMAVRFELWRLGSFATSRLPSSEDLFVLHGVARDNPKDTRLFAFINVRELAGDGALTESHLESLLLEAAAVMREYRQTHADAPQWNRITIHTWTMHNGLVTTIADMLSRFAPLLASLALEKIVVLSRDGEQGDRAIHFSIIEGRVARIRETTRASEPIRSLTPYQQTVLRLRRRGITAPYEIVRMLTPEAASESSPAPPGQFEELDWSDGTLKPVKRPIGENTCGIVVGRVSNRTSKHPEGMPRILLLGDAAHDMGSLSQPECQRIIAAIDLAEKERVPIEWFALSAGASITMTSGTENLDWTARVLRRIVEHTAKGGEINVIVAGLSVGAQSYWNAEATMLEHTKGALIMTPQGAMVLTGKKALEFSGSVSAADHQGIGGLHAIMGPNGEAQYAANDLADAVRTLFQYYRATYVAPGEARPRALLTTDSPKRDVGAAPAADDFASVGDIFSEAHNPGRKRPFDVRSVMRAVIDHDDAPLERWAPMRDAEGVIVWDAHLGGHAISLIGTDARSLPRHGSPPADGPENWTPSTLFPRGSKKIARALDAASGRRPVVILANLAGFDGSPESLRRLQLEYGAEIGRAVVEFKGPILFCVLSRYHGGAYVVFSRALNASLRAFALRGSYASVIGGAPAAAVVFRHEVDRRTKADARLTQFKPSHPQRASGERQTLQRLVETEKLAEVAAEFDATHTVERAQRVGSLDEIVEVSALRSRLIEQLSA